MKRWVHYTFRTTGNVTDFQRSGNPNITNEAVDTVVECYTRIPRTFI